MADASSYAVNVNNGTAFNAPKAAVPAPTPAPVATSNPTPNAATVAAVHPATTANAASAGSYQGVNITPGTDAEVAAQVAAIDAKNQSPATTAATNTENDNATAATKLASTTNTSNTNPFISTSDSVQSKEDSTASTVNDLNANNSATTAAHTTYLQTLAQEQANLIAQGNAEVTGINNDFNEQKAALDATQTGETAQEANIQQRSGGYLGQGASQTGALISLNQTHATEQATLESKRQSAIQAANDAIDSKNYVVAEAMAKEAKDYVAAMAKNQQDYLDNQIKIQTSQIAAVDAAQKQADNSLKAFSTLTPDEVSKIDPASLTKIDQAYGLQGFALNYIKATSAANAAKSQSDLVDAQQKMLTLLQDIPAGKTVTFPDPTNPTGPGTTYTGMGKTGDIATFSETDNNGRVTVIAYNKGSGTITRTPVGAVGKADASVQTGTRLGYMGEFISDPKNNVLVSADPSNPNAPKYMTADNYVAMYQKYTKQYPGQGAEFLSQYPVQESVIPSQRKSTELSSFAQTSPPAAGSGSSGDSNTQAGQ